jgi:hypothetical protein
MAHQTTIVTRTQRDSSAGSPFPSAFVKLKKASCPIPVHYRSATRPHWLNERDPAVSSRETIDRSRDARRSVMLASSKARSALRGDMSDLPYRRVSRRPAQTDSVISPDELRDLSTGQRRTLRTHSYHDAGPRVKRLRRA